MMKAIVAVDLNWGIGYKGNLLQRIPEDMQFFKQMTLGKIVVMGRETFESLPGKEPLKERVNIVLTRNKSFKNEKVTICSSEEELVHEVKKYNSDDVFVIGGASIYDQLLPYCSEAYVTKIEDTYTADKYFVNLDKADGWEVASSSDLKTYKAITYKFVKYVNHKAVSC
jgi:dihydrofolate reductase